MGHERSGREQGTLQQTEQGAESKIADQASSTKKRAESRATDPSEEGDRAELKEGVELICGTSAKKGWPSLI